MRTTTHPSTTSSRSLSQPRHLSSCRLSRRKSAAIVGAAMVAIAACGDTTNTTTAEAATVTSTNDVTEDDAGSPSESVPRVPPHVDDMR